MAMRLHSMKAGNQAMSVEPRPVDKHLQPELPARSMPKPSLARAALLLALLTGVTLASCHESSSYEIYTGPAVGGGGSGGAALGHGGAAEAGADSGGAAG